jgi:hypothetical protein
VPTVLRLLVATENWHLPHWPHAAIGRENIQYCVSKRVELLPSVVTIRKRTLFTRELNHPNRRVSFIPRCALLLIHFAQLSIARRLLADIRLLHSKAAHQAVATMFTGGNFLPPRHMRKAVKLVVT